MAAVTASCALAQPAPATSAERGRGAYTAKGCYQCHGLAAQGAMGVGPALAPMRLGVQGFNTYVRRPGGQMPPYSHVLLSNAEVEDIFAYLRSLPAARSASEIPLLAPYVAKPRSPK